MLRIDTTARAFRILCVGALLTACGGSSRDENAPAATPAAAPAPQSGNATVSGKGPAVKSGQPVIAILKSVQPLEVPQQTEMPVMDQISLSFTPTVIFTRPGQPAEFRNSDGELHNIRVMDDSTKEPAFNVALPTGGTYTHTFEKEGFYDVGCDIHPGMAATVINAGTPYVAIGAPDGGFSFENVVPGAYKLTVYADVQKLERDVSVSGSAVDLGEVN